MLLLEDRCFLPKLLTVVLDLSHRTLELVQSFVVPLLDLDDIILALVKQACECLESSHEEDWREVQDVLVLLLIPLGHLYRSKIHQTDSLKDLRVEFFLSLAIVLILLVWYLWVFHSLVNLFVVLLNKDLLANLLQVLHLQILHPDHLRVKHQSLVMVHFLSEARPTGREVHDQMEILAHTLKENVVELVPDCWVSPDCVTHVLKEG